MSVKEVVWRVRQNRLQKQELKRFRTGVSILTPLYAGVDAMVNDAVLNAHHFDDALSFFNGNSEIAEAVDLNGVAATPSVADAEKIELLGPYEYETYATRWHAGFNTDHTWPLLSSYRLNYRQCDKIGDARINWELNRHRQFTRLAYAYAVACRRRQPSAKALVERLAFLVDDWVKNNPFLLGISWTSPMEIALRSISWMTAARMLAAGERTELVDGLIKKLLTGVANMAIYLRQHESGFSSANNHLIIEVASVAMAGFIFRKDDWIKQSLEVLDRELHRQVSMDGVDLESSLHYHGFVLEAYLLVWYELKSADRPVSRFWQERLGGMARFISASHVKADTYCIFGDDDEARILDFGVGNVNYFRNILGFYCRLTGRETVPICPDSVVLTDGGYSFYRRKHVFVGIDHAPLGFGSIAAHGHADSLSFQYFLDGKPLLIDSGTYLYHIDLPRRNQLRCSLAHNTVTINGTDQSQMLGAFLWGKKAETRLLDFDANFLSASVKGLSGVTHNRKFEFKEDNLKITDSFDHPCSWTATFIVAPELTVKVEGSIAEICEIDSPEGEYLLRITTSTGEISAETVEVSPSYGSLTLTTALRIVGNSHENLVTLQSR